MIKKVKKNKNSIQKIDESQSHPNHSKELIRLKRAQGQLVGIMGMIEENRYCPDILIQIRAVKSAIQSVEHSVLKTHLEHCVRNVLEMNDNSQVQIKIDELIAMMDRHL